MNLHPYIPCAGQRQTVTFSTHTPTATQLKMAKEQEYEELRELLQSWDVADLLPHLQDEAINVDELQMIKRHHLAELLSNFRFGTRIRFEHHLERWRRWLNVPLQGLQGQSQTHCQGCRCAESAAPSIICQPQIGGQSDSVGDSGKSDDLAKTLPSEPLVSLTDPSEAVQATFHMPMQSQLEPSEILSSTLVTNVKEEDSGDQVQGEDHVVTVLGILQASGMKSQSLLERLGQQEALDAVQRLLLIQLICSYYEDNQLHLTLQRSHLLEREILQLFPKEQLHYYRTERRGKIYVRFTNMKRNKRVNSSRQELKRRREDLLKPPAHVYATDLGPKGENFTADTAFSPERSD
ncbi:uncharacterized protein LOC117590861 [Drosophila guanche]|uniref:Uncharacterized protein n=1 Tax=Drosophila guanche TaxID=7266 RepID=A0A3B0J6M5_DROGU|nr:uncharacterized protein LOC117590861 [Drosophila guanche]SPP75693.1 Hypothetical predicted protein [Drosophila guanche]